LDLLIITFSTFWGNSMKIEEIFEYIEKIGCLTFATISDGFVHPRIVHPYAYDEEGIYFMSMNIKPFARSRSSRPASH
jgi:uncharacterized pyridoxamine 5'-phosphate oxidase family protein